MGDYHNWYLLVDVLILADVFEAFRDMCLEYYELDPAHSFTAPGMSWQAALKMTDITLDLITDMDMYQLVEGDIRGGVSQITHSREQLNVPGYEGYNENAATKYLMYWDANNLYGWAMSQPLPVGDFKWLNNYEVNALNVYDITDDNERGYIYECDLGKFHYIHLIK